MNKERPTHNAFSTAFWVLGKQWQYARLSFVFLLLMIPIQVGEQFLGLLLSQQAVAQILAGHSFGRIMLVLGLLIGGICMLKTAAESITLMKWAHAFHFRQELQIDLMKKHLSVPYMTAESPKFQNMYRRAGETLWASALYSPITRVPEAATALVRNVVGYFLFGGVISMVSPWIAVILTVTAIINFACMRRYSRYEYENRDHWTPIDRKINYVLYKSRTFETAKDVRIYGLNTWFSELYQSLGRQRLEWDQKLLKKSFLVSLVDLIIILLRDGLAYFFLIALAIRGEITADQFVLYFTAISGFATWVGGIIESWNELHAENLKVCDLRDVLEWQEEPWWQNKVEHGEEPCGIEINHLTFQYEGAERPTLQDITVTIHPGEKVAIVGLNGAGKTTLIKNLCGLYRPDSGEIRAGGHAQREYSQSAYMALFSAVFQNFRMLQTSIAQMVASAAPDQIDRSRVQACLEMAGLWEKVQSLPQGMDTLINHQVYENGVDLSGGEQQKLMLAKAIYKDAPILILDEPTAALDPIAENEMYLRYNELTKGRTSVFISHRLSSTRFCDRILMMEEGRIVEEGTHEDLMARGGRYAQLFEVQSKYYRKEQNDGE